MSKAKFRQASNLCKKIIEAAKLAYANKRKEYINSQKLSSPNGKSLLEFPVNASVP